MRNNAINKWPKLRPCPNCGSTEHLFLKATAYFRATRGGKVGVHYDDWMVECDRCRISVCTGGYSASWAAQDWNRKFTD